MATSSLSFRIATAEDVPQIVKLANAAFNSDKTDQVFLSDERIDIFSAAEISAIMARPDTPFLCAFDGDGAFSGCVFVQKGGALAKPGGEGRAWFGILAVDPARHGTGLGSQILAYAEDYCRRTWGSTRIEFNAVNTRVDLIAWYKRRGYTEMDLTVPFPYTDDKRTVLRDGLSFVYFMKDLDQAEVAVVDG